MYVDFESYDLCQVLVVYYGVVFKNIMIGEGIDGLLGLLVWMIVGVGDCVVILVGVYFMFNYYVVGFGGQFDFVLYWGDYEDLDVFLVKVVGVKLVYFVNFDNLMGMIYLFVVVEVMIFQIFDGMLLVLDEVYGEFVDVLLLVDVNDLCVICMCIFFKVYGMVGVCVGYVMGVVFLIVVFDWV